MLNSSSLLLVEKEHNGLYELSSYLRGEGFRVNVTGDNSEALKMIKDFNPAAVIMDSAPGADDLDAIHYFRSLSSDLRIALLSASKQDDFEMRVLDCGADDFIRKPVSPQLLVRKIRAMLRRV